MVWDGTVLGQTEDWIEYLDDNDLADIGTAIAADNIQNKDIGALTQQDFDFGNLGQRLLVFRDEILAGRGFVVLRGLPVHQWRHQDVIRAYWGISTWLGDAVSQNASAHLLGHVINQRSTVSQSTRLYQTDRSLAYHSDSCDIVGLLCIRTARHGGASSIASSAAIHNHLLAEEPAALETLYSEFICDRYDEIPAGKLAYYPVRVFNEIEGKLVCCGMDPDIRSAQRLQDVAALTAEQIHALDTFQNAARVLALKMSLKPGDMQFVNNHIIVHAREQFEDYPELEKRRYMVRLWLSSPLGRALPEFLAERWGCIDVGSLRGGIKVPGAVPVVHLDPDLI